MQFTSLETSFASRGRQVLVGLFAALVLLPVPAYAAITNFQWQTPNVVGDNPFASFDANTPFALQLIMKPGSEETPFTFSEASTWTISATFTVGAAVDQLAGNIGSLESAITNVSGSAKIQVFVTGTIVDPEVDNNMFLQFYVPETSTFTNATFLDGGSATVTIEFSFTNGTQLQTNPSSPISILFSSN